MLIADNMRNIFIVICQHENVLLITKEKEKKELSGNVNAFKLQHSQGKNLQLNDRPRVMVRGHEYN